MTPQEFLDEFGTLAEAEDGVKKLRELILELAVRGKLLAPSSSGESVDELLHAIEMQREKLIKGKKARRAKLEPIDDAEPETLDRLERGDYWFATVDAALAFVVMVSMLLSVNSVPWYLDPANTCVLTESKIVPVCVWAALAL